MAVVATGKLSQCSCLEKADRAVILAALVEETEEIEKLRKKVNKIFEDIPGASKEKDVLLSQIDAVDLAVNETLSRTADTPLCGEAPEKVEAAKTTKKPAAKK